MKGVSSHGSCKNYYKYFVIASADMPNVDTTDAYVQHMAVCNCILCPVGNHLHHSSLILSYGFGQETGKEAVRILLVGFIFYILPVLSGWVVMWLETIKIRLMGD